MKQKQRNTKTVLLPAVFFVLAFFTLGIAPVFAQNPILTDEEEQTLLLFQNAFRKVSNAVLPVVVEISVESIVKQPGFEARSPFEFFFGMPDPNSKSQSQPREFRRQGLGSGVIVRKVRDKVYILTNNHVVGDADSISVTLYDGRKFDAELVGKDPRKDLALIVFETKENVPIAALGDSDKVSVGDWVLAVGNPMGFESSVTSGIVSAVGRESMPGLGISRLTDYIQTDAAINQGNSGGALVNIRGEVVGINTWIASRTGGSIGLGFAIPINNAKKAIDDFIMKGKVEYGWLGVNIGDPTTDFKKELGLEKQEGAFAYDVFMNSPADKGGILPGDFITHVNGKKISSSNNLINIVADLPAGRYTTFTVVRKGEVLNLKVRMGIRDDSVESSNSDIWPGLVVVPITDDIRERLNLDRRKGDVVIANIRDGSPAAAAGLRAGDIIKEINDSKINDLGAFYAALNDRKSKDLMFRIYRQGNEFLIGLVRR